MLRLILYSIFIGNIAVSCNKIDTDDNDDPQGYADSQVIGTWKITGLNADAPYDWDGNGVPETNLFPAIPACDKDNLYVFEPDKTGSFKKSCSLTQDGTWEIYQTKHLIITPTSAPAEMEKITAMSSTEFVTSRQVVAPSGETFTISKTWSRQ
jgi:hypothetical protein